MRNIFPLLLSMLLFGCTQFVDYSPFDTDVDINNVNTNNIADIEQYNKNIKCTDTLKFIVFADTHSYYDDFKDAVSSINKQDNISFAVCCGDITEAGLSKEYEWYNDICKRINVPTITIIGNHDYLSNGLKIYTKMFGSPNFTFTYGNYKFIAFDGIVWENKNRSPNFDWLHSEINSDTTKNCILLTHIPPWGDQHEGENTTKFESLLSAKNLMLSVHGHLHAYETKTFGSKPAIVAASVRYRTYCIISLTEDNFSHELVTF